MSFRPLRSDSSFQPSKSRMVPMRLQPRYVKRKPRDLQRSIRSAGCLPFITLSRIEALAASSSSSGTSAGSGSFTARAFDDHEIPRRGQVVALELVGRKCPILVVCGIPATVAWNRAAMWTLFEAPSPEVATLEPRPYNRVTWHAHRPQARLYMRG